MDEFDGYISREQAGKILADYIEKLSLKKPYLLAIPRGGIQVAEGVADRFKIPIHPIVVKKLPLPENPETAFGAITEDGMRIVDDEIVSYIGITNEQIEKISEKIISEIKHRKEVYGSLNREEIKSSDAIIVDDGVATGYSMIAAINSIKSMYPLSITVAVPVCAKSSYQRIKNLVDNFICPLVDETYFFAVASYYQEWFDLPEDKIKEILTKYSQKY